MTVSELIAKTARETTVLLSTHEGEIYATYHGRECVSNFHADDEVHTIDIYTREVEDPYLTNFRERPEDRYTTTETAIIAYVDIEPDFDYISRCWY